MTEQIPAYWYDPETGELVLCPCGQRERITGTYSKRMRRRMARASYPYRARGKYLSWPSRTNKGRRDCKRIPKTWTEVHESPERFAVPVPISLEQVFSGKPIPLEQVIYERHSIGMQLAQRPGRPKPQRLEAALYLVKGSKPTEAQLREVANEAFRSGAWVDTSEIHRLIIRGTLKV